MLSSGKIRAAAASASLPKLGPCSHVHTLSLLASCCLAPASCIAHDCELRVPSCAAARIHLACSLLSLCTWANARALAVKQARTPSDFRHCSPLRLCQSLCSHLLSNMSGRCAGSGGLPAVQHRVCEGQGATSKTCQPVAGSQCHAGV